MAASLAFPPAIVIDDIVRRALVEDLASGDVTTEACVDPSAVATAHAVARKPMVACGGPVFARTFFLVDPSLTVDVVTTEGTAVAAGSILWTVRGRAQSILMGERVALNFTQRMSGIATETKSYVDRKAPGSSTRITDTRKTTPGLRVLERYAVRAGGGHNHRDNLGTAVLIKDNHIVAAGGIEVAIASARARAPHTSKIECEIDRLDQLEVAIRAGAHIVLLDNMTTDQMSEAVRIAAGRVLLEASGGITLDRIAEISAVGVDAISVGALTHSVRSSDIGLDFEP
jgi:nicotinate-nucleotide pyrophosphorylase (carboxylating)